MASEGVEEPGTAQGRPADTDTLGLRAARRRTVAWCVGLAAALVVTLVVGVGAGPVSVAPGDSASILWSHLTGLVTGHGGVATGVRGDTIIWTIRVPRVVLGAAVGAGLALTGAVMQTVVRNILADPYILGVNSGASVGAAASIVLGIGAGLGDYALQGSAFVGAFLASVLVFTVARSAGRLTSTRLLMAGVAVGYALSAGTSFLIFASDDAESARSVMFWLLGSLALASWGGVLAVTVAVVVLAAVVLTVLGRRLDALAVGDDTALSLGVHPERFRMGLLVVVCLLVGVVVAMAGSIGFVGLVVPHLARRAVGGAHRSVLPVSALMGAVLLVWADIAARTLLAPQEIPIGVITAIVGAPFLLLLVRRMRTVEA
ncbi:iron ABC transporter permease [Corynebacterium bovis]|uniref:FecCD family ABC transporter permease n=1 Tax=Corynebacterium bovis TaxID=36808 RepID=UPI00313A3519